MASRHTPTAVDSFVVGSISGTVAITVCHPLDVIRTTMQLQAHHESSSGSYSSVARQIQRNGLSFLYRGFTLPFFAQGVYKAVIFSTNTLSQQYLFGEDAHQRTGSRAAVVFSSGMIAGAVNGLVVSPVEIVRTRQISHNANLSIQARITGKKLTTLDCVRNIFHEAGLMGFWRGYLLAAARDGPGIGLYMLSFDLTKKALVCAFHPSPDIGVKPVDRAPSLWMRIVAGSTAGMVFWLWALPIDSVKTLVEAAGRVQNVISNSTHVEIPAVLVSATPRGLGVLRMIGSACRQVFLTSTGRARLLRAWPVALLRGIPSAAVTLTTYDVLISKCCS